MLTKKRMEEIDELVEMYDEKERAKEDYPVDCSIIEHLWNNHPEYDIPIVNVAAEEMGVSVDELREWFKQGNEEL